MLVIIELCETNQLKLISSEALLYEIGWIPERKRKEDAQAILSLAKETIKLTPQIENLAKEMTESGIKPLDALHLATASISKTDYFCTCDNKLIKKGRQFKGLNTRIISPLELIEELDL